ncbi:MAG: hypothetical protein PSX81_03915 [bacterium]|nr:hypothetical protein [bacterium]
MMEKAVEPAEEVKVKPIMKRFYRNIIFSKTPLKTNFRFNDQFQIYPCDFKNAPKSNLINDFPLIIEYWVDENENPEVPDKWNEIKSLMSSASNQTNRLNRLTNLLSAITNHRIFFNSQPEACWGVPFPEEITDDNREEINKQSSQPFIGIYVYYDI